MFTTWKANVWNSTEADQYSACVTSNKWARPEQNSRIRTRPDQASRARPAQDERVNGQTGKHTGEHRETIIVNWIEVWICPWREAQKLCAYGWLGLARLGKKRGVEWARDQQMMPEQENGLCLFLSLPLFLIFAVFVLCRFLAFFLFLSFFLFTVAFFFLSFLHSFTFLLSLPMPKTCLCLP